MHFLLTYRSLKCQKRLLLLTSLALIRGQNTLWVNIWGMPERFAQEALGHNSKAVHRAYAKRALMKIPSLEEYESNAEGAAAKAA